jgi:hypothetical protein
MSTPRWLNARLLSEVLVLKNRILQHLSYHILEKPIVIETFLTLFLISPLRSAFVSYCRLTNQNLTFTKQVSTGDTLVKDKKRVEDYFLTTMSHNFPFTARH